MCENTIEQIVSNSTTTQSITINLIIFVLTCRIGYSQPTGFIYFLTLNNFQILLSWEILHCSRLAILQSLLKCSHIYRCLHYAACS